MNIAAKKKIAPARLIAGVGMLSAIAVILQYLEFPVSFLIPSFIKLDFSDLPELIGAFAYGPLAGAAIALVKNVIHLLATNSVGVGELSNFVLGVAFALTAGFVYNHKKTKKSALLAGILGSGIMAIISLPMNYFVIYPLYFNVMGYPQEVILQMYQALLPVKNLFQALLIFNVPFTLVKGLISVAISMFIYKPLSPVLKGKR